jgi:hypothetical protein
LSRPDLGLTCLEQFQERRLARVAEATFMPLDDARLTAGPIREAWSNFLEKLRDGDLIVQPSHGQPTRVERALLGQRDQFLYERTHLLGFFHGGNNPVVLDQRAGQITHERVPMGSVAAQMSAGF